ncbi:MAG: ABC transporter ATP-binding protein [Desulfurococcales archaeon]|nr:ABC transporter ATP-binding protein [Desulfurococcales archaeon]
MPSLLEVRNVEIMYHPFILVIKNLSLKVEEGSITTLIGPNGAGKSTLLKAISGVIKFERGRVTKGEIVFDGRNIANQDPDKISSHGLVYVAEGRRIFHELTVQENIDAVLYKWGGDPDIVYQYFPRLKARRNVRVGYLSGGEQQMLAIGLALLAKPRIMLLDEPSLGLAPKLVSMLYEAIREIHESEGITMLLAEQNARKALEIADYGYVIENGRVVLEGPAEVLREDKDIKEFYLGISKTKRSYKNLKWYHRSKRWI